MCKVKIVEAHAGPFPVKLSGILICSDLRGWGKVRYRTLSPLFLILAAACSCCAVALLGPTSSPFGL